MRLQGEFDNHFANNILIDVFQPRPWYQQTHLQLIAVLLLSIIISISYVRLRRSRKIIEKKDKT